MKLSTPSLGITDKLDKFVFIEFGRQVFQLPLSGSHDDIQIKEEDAAIILSTPSLGITWTTVARQRVDTGILSTPSLGITNRLIDEMSRSEIKAFNSLSRDHGMPTPTRSRSQRSRQKLSTPSLGITEDILAQAYKLVLDLSTPSLGITR